MHYFRNSELTKLYKVSFDTVRNWIQAAREGKNELALYEEDGKAYVANTVKNQEIIKELAEKGKKFKNSRGLKVVTPSPEFYKLFNSRQVLDIISNLSTYREIPLKYTYFDGGAQYWDRYVQRLALQEAPNTLRSTIELLDSNFENIERLFGERKYINVIDLGLGNAMPVHNLLSNLTHYGLLRRYIGIDISEEMLRLATRNLKKWFGNSISIETYQRDFSAERFDDLFVDEYLGDSEDAPLNLVLLLGGTLSNFRQPNDVLRVINNSMAPDDLLVYSKKLDTPNSRQYFDFNLDNEVQRIPEQDRFIVDLLNIDESLYEVEREFDKKQRTRFLRIRLKLAISIVFKFPGGERRVDLNKDDAIILWRARHETAQNVIDKFTANGFRFLHASTTRDHEYLLTVSEIDTAAGPAA